MLGREMGSLNVYLHVNGENERKLIFAITGNQGIHWKEANVMLPDLPTGEFRVCHNLHLLL